MNIEEGCCIVQCDLDLGQEYWDNQWKTSQIGWDIGSPSPQLVQFIDEIENKACRILIPGCGSAYEAKYLVDQGFQDITLIDISPKACELLREKFNAYPQVQVICQDFFDLDERYDIILEQTFFCALPKNHRVRYVWKMNELLNQNGKLRGLLFNREFDQSPPFGGSQAEYEKLFSNIFHVESMVVSSLSIEPRAGSELAFSMAKNSDIVSTLYSISGVTCMGCKNEIEEKLSRLPNAIQVLMSIDFRDVLILSEHELPISALESALAYESKYKIKKYL